MGRPHHLDYFQPAGGSLPVRHCAAHCGGSRGSLRAPSLFCRAFECCARPAIFASRNDPGCPGLDSAGRGALANGCDGAGGPGCCNGVWCRSAIGSASRSTRPGRVVHGDTCRLRCHHAGGRGQPICARKRAGALLERSLEPVSGPWQGGWSGVRTGRFLAPLVGIQPGFSRCAERGRGRRGWRHSGSDPGPIERWDICASYWDLR